MFGYPAGLSKRYRQVLGILAKHGLEQLLPTRKTTSTGNISALHLRLALEELGACYIKLGQILSTRQDLLPSDWIQELEQLQSTVPPVSFADIELLLTEEMGDWKAQYFLFRETPLAAASIAQVHQAETRDGKTVVVKVQRPHIQEQIQMDLLILRHLVKSLKKHTNIDEIVDIEGVLEEFSYTLLNELDFRKEAQNMERMRKNFSRWRNIRIPQVDWSRTTSRVLTMEEMHGVSLKELAQKKDPAAQKRNERIATLSANAIMKMVFEDGFFHADPHPGNFLVSLEDDLILMDFGMVGQLDVHTQEALIAMASAFSRQDAEEIVDALIELGMTAEELNREVLEIDMKRLIQRIYGRDLAEINMGEVLGDLMQVLRKHRIRLPATVSLLFKMLIMAEGTGQMLYPELHLHEIMEGYIRELMKQRLHPARIGEELYSQFRLWHSISKQLPRTLKTLLQDAENQRFTFHVEPKGTEPIIRQLHAMVNRFTIAMIVAAFTIATALLLTVYHPGIWERFLSWLLLSGFLLSLVLGVALVIGILRSGRKR